MSKHLAAPLALPARSMLMMLSNVASIPIEPATQARGASLWQQLCPTEDWAVTAAVVRRAERAGSPAIVLTVDNLPGRNNETLKRAMLADSRVCTDCHVNNSRDLLRTAPMYSGLDLARAKTLAPMNMTLGFLYRLRALVSVSVARRFGAWQRSVKVVLRP